MRLRCVGECVDSRAAIEGIDLAAKTEHYALGPEQGGVTRYKCTACGAEQSKATFTFQTAVAAVRVVVERGGRSTSEGDLAFRAVGYLSSLGRK